VANPEPTYATVHDDVKLMLWERADGRGAVAFVLANVVRFQTEAAQSVK
jgi:hypothetical protein